MLILELEWFFKLLFFLYVTFKWQFQDKRTAVIFKWFAKLYAPRNRIPPLKLYTSCCDKRALKKKKTILVVEDFTGFSWF